MHCRSIGLGIALLALAGVGSADAGNAKGTKTVDISFDGFCDTMQVTVFPWHQAGTALTNPDCESGIGAGMEGMVKGAQWPGKTLTIGENGNVPGVFLWNIQYPLVTGGGWSVYSTTDGVNFTYESSGTYTVEKPGAPARHAGPPIHSGTRR